MGILHLRLGGAPIPVEYKRENTVEIRGVSALGAGKKALVCLKKRHRLDGANSRALFVAPCPADQPLSMEYLQQLMNATAHLPSDWVTNMLEDTCGRPDKHEGVITQMHVTEVFF